MNEHDELEQSIGRALRREPAPPGFADRIFARTTRRQKLTAWWTGLFHSPALSWSLGMIVLIGTITGTHVWTLHRERIDGQHAKQQLMFALKITANKVQFAERRLRPETNE